MNYYLRDLQGKPIDDDIRIRQSEIRVGEYIEAGHSHCATTAKGIFRVTRVTPRNDGAQGVDIFVSPLSGQELEAVERSDCTVHRMLTPDEE